MAFDQNPAVVSKPSLRSSDPIEYLVLTAHGPVWSRELAAAAVFDSMAEAARMALRLPGRHRAFGLPLRGERATQLH